MRNEILTRMLAHRILAAICASALILLTLLVACSSDPPEERPTLNQPMPKPTAASAKAVRGENHADTPKWTSGASAESAFPVFQVQTVSPLPVGSWLLMGSSQHTPSGSVELTPAVDFDGFDGLVATTGASTGQRIMHHVSLRGSLALQEFGNRGTAAQLGGNGTPISDRLALFALYVATGGPSWANNENWLSSAPLDQWHGVSANGSGRVTRLDLAGNGLRGTIPANLGGSAARESSILPYLEHVNFENNELSGSIPAALGLLTSLKTLLLSGNQLNGPIPDELAHLTSLEALSLGGSNRLTECIPDALRDVPTNDLLSLNMPFCGISEPTPGAVPFTRNTAEDFSALGINDPEGIWSDGRTMWVSSPALDQILAYDLETKARDASKDFKTLAANNGDPQALWSKGKTMWVGEGTHRQADGAYGWVFAYKLDINADGTARPEHGVREASKEFDPARGSSPRGIWSDKSTIWITQTRTGTTGDIRAYRLNVNADGAPGPGLGEPGKDFDGVAGEGLWSDGTTLWVAKGAQEQIHAYDLETRVRVESKDFNSLGGFAQGIWSDGKIMWVCIGHQIHAYNMPPFSTNEAAPEPVTPDPVTPDPVTPEPVTPEPVTPDPVTPEPVTPDPVTPEPPDPGPSELTTHPDDLRALRALYNATGGPHWSNNTNWLDESVPLDQWEGVTTNDAGRVTILALHGNDLTGEIPALAGLSELKTLKLSNNRLQGPVPQELGDLANLKRLDLSGNRLGDLSGTPHIGGTQASGGIPAQLGNLTSLVVLNFSNNRLTEQLPVELGSLTNLLSLALNGNNFTGPIPVAWGGFNSFSSLTYLNLSDNILSGEIPWQLGNLTSLQYLYLSNNDLSVGIPVVDEYEGQTAGLGSLRNLKALDLSNNDLSGAIPAELASLPNLEHLYLQENRLSGSIPPRWGGPLKQLVLSGNELSGAIPAGLGDLENLTHLYLDQNSLSGRIPSSLSSLTKLTVLSLWQNDLSGNIPPRLGDLTQLIHLVLSFNEFQGSIPPQLGQLARLKTLHLNDNQLGGEIPADLGKLYSIEVMYLQGNSELTGCVPSALKSVEGLDRVAKYQAREQVDGYCLTDAAGPGEFISDRAGSAEADRAALVTFYNATVGSNWKWGSDCSEWDVDNENADVNGWCGVTVDKDGRVTKLELPGYNLHEKIPPEIGDLSMLTHLNLSGLVEGKPDRTNRLDGALPPELDLLTELTHLNLSGNAFRGDISKQNLHHSRGVEWSKLRNLVDLNLSENKTCGLFGCSDGLSGSIRKFARLSNLDVLNLSGNQLNEGALYVLEHDMGMGGIRPRGETIQMNFRDNPWDVEPEEYRDYWNEFEAEVTRGFVDLGVLAAKKNYPLLSVADEKSLNSLISALDDTAQDESKKITARAIVHIAQKGKWARSAGLLVKGLTVAGTASTGIGWVIFAIEVAYILKDILDAGVAWLQNGPGAMIRESSDLILGTRDSCLIENNLERGDPYSEEAIEKCGS